MSKAKKKTEAPAEAEQKVITELTEAQIAKMPEYVDKWVKIGLSTEPCDFEKSIEYAKEAYRLAGLDEPFLFIGPVNNPVEGAIAEQVLREQWVGKEITPETNALVLAEVNRRVDSGEGISYDISNQIYGNQEIMLSFYDYFEEVVGIECCKKLAGLKKLATVCGWWTPLKGVCIFQHRPAEIHRNAEGQTHNLNGPAIKFRKESVADVYKVRNVRVPKKVITREYTVDDIEKESNLEIRRVMIELYGQAKYLLDSNAQVVHKDDFGTLYRKEVAGDEPILMVKVVNSTAEPDGTYKDYFIRVDPNAYGGLKTAQQAVASTWRNKDGSLKFKTPEEYDPSVET